MPQKPDWPVRECLGVLVGILGLEWLLVGRANLWIAVLATLAVGVTILLLRRIRRRGDVRK